MALGSNLRYTTEVTRAAAYAAEAAAAPFTARAAVAPPGTAFNAYELFERTHPRSPETEDEKQKWRNGERDEDITSRSHYPRWKLFLDIPFVLNKPLLLQCQSPVHPPVAGHQSEERMVAVYKDNEPVCGREDIHMCASCDAFFKRNILNSVIPIPEEASELRRFMPPVRLTEDREMFVLHSELIMGVFADTDPLVAITTREERQSGEWEIPGEGWGSGAYALLRTSLHAFNETGFERPVCDIIAKYAGIFQFETFLGLQSSTAGKHLRLWFKNLSFDKTFVVHTSLDGSRGSGIVIHPSAERQHWWLDSVPGFSKQIAFATLGTPRGDSVGMVDSAKLGLLEFQITPFDTPMDKRRNSFSSECRDPGLTRRMRGIFEYGEGVIRKMRRETRRIFDTAGVSAERLERLQKRWKLIDPSTPGSDQTFIKDMPIACFLENKSRCTITVHVRSDDVCEVIGAVAVQIFQYEMKRRSRSAKDQIISDEPYLFKSVFKYWDADRQAIYIPGTDTQRIDTWYWADLTLAGEEVQMFPGKSNVSESTTLEIYLRQLKCGGVNAFARACESAAGGSVGLVRSDKDAQTKWVVDGVDLGAPIGPPVELKLRLCRKKQVASHPRPAGGVDPSLVAVREHKRKLGDGDAAVADENAQHADDNTPATAGQIALSAAGGVATVISSISQK